MEGESGADRVAIIRSEEVSRKEVVLPAGGTDLSAQQDREIAALPLCMSLQFLQQHAGEQDHRGIFQATDIGAEDEQVAAGTGATHLAAPVYQETSFLPVRAPKPASPGGGGSSAGNGTDCPLEMTDDVIGRFCFNDSWEVILVRFRLVRCLGTGRQRCFRQWSRDRDGRLGQQEVVPGMEEEDPARYLEDAAPGVSREQGQFIPVPVRQDVQLPGVFRGRSPHDMGKDPPLFRVDVMGNGSINHDQDGSLAEAGRHTCTPGDESRSRLPSTRRIARHLRGGMGTGRDGEQENEYGNRSDGRGGCHGLFIPDAQGELGNRVEMRGQGMVIQAPSGRTPICTG